MWQSCEQSSELITVDIFTNMIPLHWTVGLYRRDILITLVILASTFTYSLFFEMAVNLKLNNFIGYIRRVIEEKR